MREALRAIFAAAQHEVVEAADAGVGLSAYRQEPADAVFVDMASCGRMAASEFIRQLRKDSPEARVVAMSARTSLGTANPLAMAKQMGAVRTIRVPCPGTEILGVLEEVRL
jgi:DNA-binding NtrC family response regulator